MNRKKTKIKEIAHLITLLHVCRRKKNETQTGFYIIVYRVAYVMTKLSSIRM